MCARVAAHNHSCSEEQGIHAAAASSGIAADAVVRGSVSKFRVLLREQLSSVVSEELLAAVGDSDSVLSLAPTTRKC